MNPKKRLYRSNDSVFAGVCGGIAEYLDFDPTIIRILTVLLVLAGFGIPIIAYLIALIVMPKQPNDYTGYIDVEPSSPRTYSATPQAATADQASQAASSASASQAASASQSSWTAPPDQTAADQTNADHATTDPSPQATYTAAPGSSAPGPSPQPDYSATPPGRAYTTSNPQAYDAGPINSPVQEAAKPRRRLQTGIILGIILVCVGLIALFGVFLNISPWRFWPLIVVILGFAVLCTPGEKGWSLARAGNGIVLVVIGCALQLWALGIVSAFAFWRILIYLWPVLLIVIGLSIIGAATKQSAFNLFGSLLLCATILVGMWSFGQIGGQAVDVVLPGGRVFSITIPAPDIFPFDNDPLFKEIHILPFR
ncbi:MAG: PspC domain-containing protein [Coriobacteriia bacterium]|nr:PspC domain-containing protein [Coriobacteriia bacterium]